MVKIHLEILKLTHVHIMKYMQLRIYNQ